MLKISGSIESTIKLKKSEIRVGGDSIGESCDDDGHDDEHPSQGLGQTYQQTH